MEGIDDEKVLEEFFSSFEFVFFFFSSWPF